MLRDVVNHPQLHFSRPFKKTVLYKNEQKSQDEPGILIRISLLMIDRGASDGRLV
jgi:hypothetical protein